jgi:hypothetical protein
MEREDMARVLARGAAALGSFLPEKTDLLFPILYAACVWAARRVFNYRDHLLTWRIWLDPEIVLTKADGLVLKYFENDPRLKEIFSGELGARDLTALRKAFRALYPVCVLEDAFLAGLFRDELAAGDFRKIVEEFGGALSRTWEDLRAVEANRDFWEFLEGLGMEIASLEIHRFSDEEVRSLIDEALPEKPAAGKPAGKGE